MKRLIPLLIVSLVAGCGEKKVEEAAKPAEAAPTASPTAEAEQAKEIPAPADVAAPPADAVKTASGLAYKQIAAGTGTEKPTGESRVTVHYTGWTTDGKMFDSSVTRGKPTSFNLDKVIPGWTEGVALMVEGEKTRFWIPEEMAYKGKPGRPQGMLVFDIELLSFQKPIVAPEDVAAPPKDATKTKSGIYYKELVHGTGTAHPTADSRVTVHYTGWQTDGKMFDSSVMRERPATFSLARVIPGWTEGVQLMVEGQKMRFWIPEELAYKDKPGRPQGMLVFDIELQKILPAAPQLKLDRKAAGPSGAVQGKTGKVETVTPASN